MTVCAVLTLWVLCSKNWYFQSWLHNFRFFRAQFGLYYIILCSIRIHYMLTNGAVLATIATLFFRNSASILKTGVFSVKLFGTSSFISSDLQLYCFFVFVFKGYCQLYVIYYVFYEY